MTDIVPTLEKVLAGWSDTKSCFLSFIPVKQKQQKE